MFPTENPWFWFTSASIACVAWLATELYWLKREKKQASLTQENISQYVPPDNEIDEDAAAVKSNPGNHRRVIRCIIKAGAIKEADSLFHDYMAAPSLNMDFSIDVFAAYILKKYDLSSEEQRGKWWADSHNEANRQGYEWMEVLRAIDRLTGDAPFLEYDGSEV